MGFETFSAEELDRRVEGLISARTPTDVFKVLLEGSRVAAPRVAVYLVRKGRIKGWGSVGFGTEPAERLRAHAAPADAGWLGRLAESEEPLHETGSPGAEMEFGQPQAAETFGVAVRVKSRPIALIVAERAEDEPPWLPGLLRALVRVARLRLDVDLLKRKLQATADAQETASAETSPPDEAVGSAADPAGTVPAAEAAPAEPPDEKQLEAARRYARLVATDIRLYNEEAVMLGRRNGDLVERLGDHLGRAREMFLRRHGTLGPAGLQILREAFVQVLAAGDESLLPSSILD